MGLKTKVEEEIYEKSSWDLSFNLFAEDGITPVTPSGMKVYVYLKNSANTPTYINGRDGSDDTGLTNNANAISLHLKPADNQITGTGEFKDLPYEDHIVLIELEYNTSVDKDFFEWQLRVMNLQPVS